MRRSVIVCAILVVLTGCRTGIYVSPSREEPDSYYIAATPPGGMFGGFVGLEPSVSVLPKEASTLCPQGYDKLSEGVGNFEGKFIHWTIRCHAGKSP